MDISTSIKTNVDPSGGARFEILHDAKQYTIIHTYINMLCISIIYIYVYMYNG